MLRCTEGDCDDDALLACKERSVRSDGSLQEDSRTKQSLRSSVQLQIATLHARTDPLLVTETVPLATRRDVVPDEGMGEVTEPCPVGSKPPHHELAARRPALVYTLVTTLQDRWLRFPRPPPEIAKQRVGVASRGRI